MTKTVPLPYYAQTLPGVEEIAWLEIRKRLRGASFGEYLFAKNQNGIVTFGFEGKMDDLLQLRTTEDVFLQAVSLKRMTRSNRDLSQVSHVIAKGESFGRAANALLRRRRFSSPPTYRVISRKYGQHQYRRKDLELAALRGIQSRYPSWKPVGDGGQLEVWVNMLGSRLLIGLRVSDRSMRHRYDKAVELPASLRPSLAAAMVLLSDPQPEDVFLDPLCGSGTLLLERINAGPYRSILAGDIARDRVEATRQNLRKAKGPQLQGVSVRAWDAQALPLDPGSVSKVATNLPFGRQVAAEENLEQLYAGVLDEVARVVRPDGLVVLLSSEYELLRQQLRLQPKLEIDTGYSVATLGQWGRIYVIARTA